MARRRDELEATEMANVRHGKSKASGMVNNVKVRCDKCGTEQYLSPGSDPWVCYSCSKQH